MIGSVVTVHAHVRTLRFLRVTRDKFGRDTFSKVSSAFLIFTEVFNNSQCLVTSLVIVYKMGLTF